MTSAKGSRAKAPVATVASRRKRRILKRKIMSPLD